MTQRVKKLLKISLFTLFVIVISIYALFRSNDLIFGVKIKDVNIVDGSKATENILRVIGKARNATDLTLNGRTISIDKEGNFNETIVLLSGYNIVSIEAKDKFVNEDEAHYQLIY